MKSRRTSLVLVIGGLLALAAPAQAEPLSRRRAIAQAVEQNPQVAAARARRAHAAAEKAEADAARWPEITLEVGVGPSLRAERVPGTAVESTKSRYDLGADDLSVVVGGRLSIVQPLYTFGKIDSFRAAAAHGIRARDAQVTMTQADVALEVARLYESLLFARDTARFLEELESYVARTIIATEERVKAGAAELGEQDVLRMEAALAGVRLGLQRARAGRLQAAAALAAYLGLGAGATIEPAEDELHAVGTVEVPAARLAKDALGRRPELVALDQGARAYGSLAAAEEAASYPDLFLMAFASGAYTPGRDAVESRYVVDPLLHFDPGILLGLRWRIQGPTASARSEQREAQARELRHLRSWAAAGAPAQVAAAHADVERARRDIAEASAAVVKAKRWTVQANADWVVGLGSSLAVVDSTRAYAELRAAELDATFRHNVAMAELAHATGTIVGDTLGLYPGKEPR